MGINGKSKGNKGERMVAQWFKDWTGYEFARVPQSGGLRWKHSQNTAGDIICSDPKHSRFFKLCVESKFYLDLDWDKLFRNKKADIQRFWEQAKSDAERAEKIPILFMRKNGMDKDMFYVMVNYKVWKAINKLSTKQFVYPCFIIKSTQEKVVIINSLDLIHIDYQELHKLLKKIK